MKAFIKSIDEKAWKSILVGWTPPTTKNEAGKVVPKDEIAWTEEANKISNYNSKAINGIFNGVSPMQFKSISNDISAEEPSNIRQTEFEE